LKSAQKKSKKFNPGAQLPARKDETLKADKTKTVTADTEPTVTDRISEGEYDDSDPGMNGHSDEDEDDRTVALIKGFESSGDEDPSEDEGFDPNKALPSIPDPKKTKRKILKRQTKISEVETPGTVYIG
jgi:nucleolar protein 15